jgi:AraC family transcriptional regulator
MFGFEHHGEGIPVPVVLAGLMPTPVASSCGRGWRGLVVERYRGANVDVVLQSPAVLVALGPRPGAASLIPAGRHWHWSAQACAQEFVALWLDPALIDAVASEMKHDPAQRVELVETHGARDAQLERIAESLIVELASEQRCAAAYVEAIAIQLAVQLLRRHARIASCDSRVRAVAGTLSPAKLRRAAQFIDRHICEDLTLAQIAGCVDMSPCHFAHMFKQATGQAPHHYLMTRRVESAKCLLRETDLSIAEIAHRVGCTNQSHFSTLFHRAEAMSPRAFRQHH